MPVDVSDNDNMSLSIMMIARNMNIENELLDTVINKRKDLINKVNDILHKHDIELDEFSLNSFIKRQDMHEIYQILKNN